MLGSHFLTNYHNSLVRHWRAVRGQRIGTPHYISERSTVMSLEMGKLAVRVLSWAFRCS